jgi:hypothetical protein
MAGEFSSLSIASALLRRLICACEGRRAVVPHSCDCKTGPPSDVIHGPDVSWFGAFEWVWVPGDTSSCLQHLRCLAWPFLLAWRMGMVTGDARLSLQTTVTAWPNELGRDTALSTAELKGSLSIRNLRPACFRRWALFTLRRTRIEVRAFRSFAFFLLGSVPVRYYGTAKFLYY